MDFQFTVEKWQDLYARPKTEKHLEFVFQGIPFIIKIIPRTGSIINHLCSKVCASASHSHCKRNTGVFLGPKFAIDGDMYLKIKFIYELMDVYGKWYSGFNLEYNFNSKSCRDIGWHNFELANWLNFFLKDLDVLNLRLIITGFETNCE